MHPHLLHALAATWSLEAARTALAARARVEAEQIAAEQALRANDGLRSTVYGNRTSSGGHGDPTLTIAILGVNPAPRPNRWQQLADSTTDTLTWLTTQLQVPGHTCGGDPLGLLRTTIPTLLPGTAATVHRWLAEADHRIRQPLQMQPDRWALPGAPECPSCRQRLLYVQTSGPGVVWTVICGAGCVCVGPACPCGMPVRVEGVGHIWDRSAAIVTTALIRDH